MVVWLLAEKSGQGAPTISTADWIIIGLTAATLAVASIGTVIAWWVFLRPAVHLVLGDAGDFEVIGSDSGGSSTVSGRAFVASAGTWMLSQNDCRILSGGFSLPFLSRKPIGATVTELRATATFPKNVYVGGMSLALKYYASFPKIVPGTESVLLDIRLKIQGERLVKERYKVRVRWVTPPNFGTAQPPSQ